MKKSKFDISSQIPLSFRIKDFFRSLVFWKGRSKGVVHTCDLEWGDFRYIFFPKGFEEKYGYLGTSIYESSHYFNQIYPLILAMDYEAKPKWCPRWFLRFLHVFGNDRSIVRVRNHKLSNLLRNLTKGITFWDWKTKWHDYDLRLSISGPQHLEDLADAIERSVYMEGRHKHLIEQIRDIEPDFDKVNYSVKDLEYYLEDLKDESNTRV